MTILSCFASNVWRVLVLSHQKKKIFLIKQKKMIETKVMRQIPKRFVEIFQISEISSFYGREREREEKSLTFYC